MCLKAEDNSKVNTNNLNSISYKKLAKLLRTHLYVNVCDGLIVCNIERYSYIMK